MHGRVDARRIRCYYFHPFVFYDDNGQPTTYLQAAIARIWNQDYICVNSTAVAPMWPWRPTDESRLRPKPPGG
jgi:hypothetical protein